jgi:hypothetical protein
MAYPNSILFNMKSKNKLKNKKLVEPHPFKYLSSHVNKYFALSYMASVPNEPQGFYDLPVKVYLSLKVTRLEIEVRSQFYSKWSFRTDGVAFHSTRTFCLSHSTVTQGC